MHCGTAGQAGVPGEQLVAGVKTFIRERGQKANILTYCTRVADHGWVAVRWQRASRVLPKIFGAHGDYQAILASADIFRKPF
jgi:hypothetical protein